MNEQQPEIIWRAEWAIKRALGDEGTRPNYGDEYAIRALLPVLADLPADHARRVSARRRAKAKRRAGASPKTTHRPEE